MAKRHHIHKVRPMQIYLSSISKNPDITHALLDQIADAIEYQLCNHVANFWQAGPCSVKAVSSTTSIPTDEDGICPLIVCDTPDQANVLGWHSYDSKTGRMPAFVFVEPILGNGGTLIKGANSLSVTISHEAVEASCDPYVNDYAFVNATTIEPKEACDRVEGDSYEIAGVSVSNFLGPRAFRDGPGPYDWLRLMSDPWEVRPGGYCQRIDVVTGQDHTIWGSEMPDWKRELKGLKAKHRLSRLNARKELLTRTA